MKVITTAEQLRALPADAVVRDAEGIVMEAFDAADNTESRRWCMPNYTLKLAESSIQLPVFVLWDPRDNHPEPEDAVPHAEAVRAFDGDGVC